MTKAQGDRSGADADRSWGMRTGRRGLLVIVVGPDGAGKTSVASELIRTFDGTARYFHFIPPIIGKLEYEASLDMPAPPDKGRACGSILGGWLRLDRNFARYWIGYMRRIRPSLRSGELVVGDRWGYGYLVQPHALKFYGPARLAALALRLMPKPDVVLNISGDPAVMFSRKQDLTIDQIRSESEAWSMIPAPHLWTFDNTTGTVVETASEISERLAEWA